MERRQLTNNRRKYQQNVSDLLNIKKLDLFLVVRLSLMRKTLALELVSSLMAD